MADSEKNTKTLKTNSFSPLKKPSRRRLPLLILNFDPPGSLDFPLPEPESQGPPPFQIPHFSHNRSPIFFFFPANKIGAAPPGHRSPSHLDLTFFSLTRSHQQLLTPPSPTDNGSRRSSIFNRRQTRLVRSSQPSTTPATDQPTNPTAAQPHPLNQRTGGVVSPSPPARSPQRRPHLATTALSPLLAARSATVE